MSSSSRWRRVDWLFHAALALPASDREAFLAAESRDDHAIFDEVRSLVLADADGSAARYEDCAPQVAAAWAAETTGSLAGQTIGRYRILEPLGAGATGEVYRAKDTALGREVALKALLPSAGDGVRMPRLEREACAASALNHPNILTIHDIGLVRGIQFIAAELVAGETLRDRLARGPLPLGDALDIAAQIAAGLRAAHAAAVVHRDIKPENLMLRPDGLVKIVDFGLAEPMAAAAPEDGWSAASTAAAIGGTLSYMSPEQVRGEPLDARTDLFSLGVVLYEMVAGDLPFERESAAATIEALQHEALTPLSGVNPTVPPELNVVVARALEKDRERRYQTASELEADLKRLQQSTVRSDDASAEKADADGRVRRRGLGGRRRVALGTAAVVSITAGLLWLSGIHGLEPAAPDPARHSFVRVSRLAGEELFPSLAPGGDAVLYASAASGNWDIYRHRIDGAPVNLTSGSDFDDLQPVYSPDGQRILFRSERDGGGLFLMSATGESVSRVSDIGWDPAWSPDGREIACSTARVEPTTIRLPASELWIVDPQTGRKRRLLEGPAYQPQWSPSGERIAFFGPDAAGQRDLFTVAAAGGDPVRVTNDRYVDWNPVWSADGRFLYFLSDRDGTMNGWHVRIDQTTGRPLGEPRPFTLPAANVMFLARTAGSDRLTWSSRYGGGMIQRYELDPVRGRVIGKPVPLTSASRSLVEPEISPDGTLLVANTRGDSHDDLVVLRADGTQVRALTEDDPADRFPRWSPDGRRIAFWSDRKGGTAIFVVDSDGSRLEQVSAAEDLGACCPVWSPDGRDVAYLANDLAVHAVDLTRRVGASRDRILAKLPSGVWFQPVSWSPDAVRLAGQERRSNKPRAGVAIYDLTTKQYTRLTTSGGRPIWLNDNRRLIYSDGSSAYLIDTVSRQTHELFSVAPYQNPDMTVSRDSRSLWVSVRANEADVWVTTPR